MEISEHATEASLHDMGLINLRHARLKSLRCQHSLEQCCTHFGVCFVIARITRHNAQSLLTYTDLNITKF